MTPTLRAEAKLLEAQPFVSGMETPLAGLCLALRVAAFLAVLFFLTWVSSLGVWPRGRSSAVLLQVLGAVSLLLSPDDVSPALVGPRFPWPL